MTLLNSLELQNLMVLVVVIVVAFIVLVVVMMAAIVIVAVVPAVRVFTSSLPRLPITLSAPLSLLTFIPF